MKILPASAVNSLLWQERKRWDVLSICREGDLPLIVFCRRHCHVNCDDLSDGDLYDPEVREQIAALRRIAPSPAHIQQALGFAREVGTEHLVIHCRQAISRSPAIAFCILLDQLRSTNAAIERLYQLRPQAIPNSLIVRLGLQVVLGSDADFDAVIAEMRLRGGGAEASREMD